MIRRLFQAGIIAAALCVMASLGSVLLYEPPARNTTYAAIVVLSEGVFPDGELSAQTAARTMTAVALFEDGLAPRVVFSGGLGGTEPASKGALMADVAREAGLPADAILIEGDSHSTLQNALFTADIVPELRQSPVLLVTHRYHGLRSLASFWWAGFEDVSFAAADPDAIVWDGAEWEPVKWAGNIVRAAAFSIATAVGVDRATADPWLR